MVGKLIKVDSVFGKVVPTLYISFKHNLVSPDITYPETPKLTIQVV